jgi:predicted DNA-binding protein
MDINTLEKNIINNSRQYKNNKSTMFGINLGLELNQRLTNYANQHGISKSSVVKTLLKTYLDEKESA